MNPHEIHMRTPMRTHQKRMFSINTFENTMKTDKSISYSFPVSTIIKQHNILYDKTQIELSYRNHLGEHSVQMGSYEKSPRDPQEIPKRMFSINTFEIS